MKQPLWNCHRNNALLQRELERELENWTLALLDKLDNDLVTERDIEIMEAMNSNPDYREWVYQEFERNIEIIEATMEAMDSNDEYHKWVYQLLWSDQQLKRMQLRARVVKAAKAKDTRLLLRLTANNPELQQLADQLLIPKSGRPKGSRKTDSRGKKRIISADITPDERSILERARIDVGRIYDIWQATIWEDNRTHRKSHPTSDCA